MKTPQVRALPGMTPLGIKKQDRIETEKEMLCDFLMVNFDKAKAYKLALELLSTEALNQLKKAVRS